MSDNNDDCGKIDFCLKEILNILLGLDLYIHWLYNLISENFTSIFFFNLDGDYHFKTISIMLPI